MTPGIEVALLLVCGALSRGWAAPDPVRVPETGRSPGYRVSVVSALEKVFPSGDFASRPERVAKLSLARNEYEAFQLVVAAPSQAVTVQDLIVSNLERDAGGMIPAGGIKWSRVDYVRTTVKPPYPVDHLGDYPDPLMPAGPFRVNPGRHVPVWIELHAPKHIPSGVYRGTVTVKVRGKPSTVIPLEATVFGFTLTDDTHLRTMTWLSSGGVKAYYRKHGASEPNFEAYQDLLLQHRLGPGGLVPTPRKTKHGWDFSAVDRTLGRLIGKGMNAFLIGTAPNLAREGKQAYSPQFIQSFCARLKAWEDHLRQKGWLDRAYVYTFDEAPRKYWSEVTKIARAIHRSAPGLRVFQCLNDPAGVNALAGCVDVFDVYVAQYHKTGVQAMQQAKGTRVWLAVCCYPQVHPNLFIEYPLLDARLLPLFCWKYHAQGFEYWSPVAWGAHNTEVFTPAVETHSWNPNTFGRYNGDGCLLYPGAGGAPYSSLRLKALRDGFEDYEYLWTLSRRVRQASAKGQRGATITRAKALLNLDGLINSDGTWNHDAAHYQAFRTAVARSIVALEK
jgi:Glycoside hydrolase 123, catalytic domain